MSLVPVLIEDRRLKDWEPLWVPAPAGAAVTVASLSEHLVERYGLWQKILRVTVGIQPSEGQPAYRAVHYLERAKAKRPETFVALWGLITESLGRSREQVELEAEGVLNAFADGHRNDLRMVDSGPVAHLDALTIECAAALQGEIESLGRAGTEVDFAHVLRLVDRAYDLGRQVRAAELPKDQKRSLGYRGRADASADAEAWWPAGGAWAQALWDNYPKGWRDDRRQSFNGLANEMYDRWNARPFAPEGPARIDPHDLSKRVLRAWRDRGLVSLVKSSPPHRGSGDQPET